MNNEEIETILAAAMAVTRIPLEHRARALLWITEMTTTPAPVVPPEKAPPLPQGRPPSPDSAPSRIVKYLKKSGISATPCEIAEHLGLSTSHVSSALTRLIRKGRVWRTDSGEYMAS